MAIKLSGIVSGMDTDAMVEELVSAYSTKKDKYVKAQTKLEWKQDAWKALNTKIYGFYTKSLSNMRFSTAFDKKVASSTSTKATITASSNAVIGTQTLKINQLAKAGYLTGGVVKNIDGKTKIKGDTKLKDLGIVDGSSYSVTVGGKTTDITVNEDTTVNQMIANLKDAGVSASFDETNQRFFINAKNSGKAGDFSITANSSDGIESLKAMGLYATSTSDMSTYSNMAALDVDAATEKEYEKKKTAYTTADAQTKLLEAQIKAYDTEKTKLEDKKQIAEYKADYAAMSDEDKETETANVNDRIADLEAKKKADLTDDEKKELTTLKNQLTAIKDVDKNLGNDTYTEDDKQAYIDSLTKDVEDIGADIDTLSNKSEANQAILDGTADADALGYSDIDSYVESLNNKIDEDNEALKDSIKEFYTTQKATGQEMVDAYDVIQSYSSIAEPSEEETAAYNAAIEKLGMGEGTAVRISGSDASITLNGAEFTSTNNSFSINGLTIQADAVTDPDETITITTNQDTQGIYDMVKSFLKDYNTLVNEMDSLYNASSAKGYEPLTDDEKEAMTDTEVEKWETKIKDALLRRDSTLDSVTNAMKDAMNKSFSIDGTSYSLSSFGIKTLGYFTSSDNEKGAYHIDGDSEDSSTSGNKDKLLKAIANDPDKITSFFNSLAENMYTQLSNKMKTSSVSSAYTVYNDKQMKKDYEDYDDVIDKWDEKITAYEEKYRKQFVAMEKAMSSMNSQQSQLSSLLGQ